MAASAALRWASMFPSHLRNAKPLTGYTIFCRTLLRSPVDLPHHESSKQSPESSEATLLRQLHNCLSASASAHPPAAQTWATVGDDKQYARSLQFNREGSSLKPDGLPEERMHYGEDGDAAQSDAIAGRRQLGSDTKTCKVDDRGTVVTDNKRFEVVKRLSCDKGSGEDGFARNGCGWKERDENDKETNRSGIQNSFEFDGSDELSYSPTLRYMRMVNQRNLAIAPSAATLESCFNASHAYAQSTYECMKTGRRDKIGEFDELGRELEEVYYSLLPLESQIIEKDASIKYLEMCTSKLYTKYTISPFGSVINGFWTHSSDVDICIQLQECESRSAEIKALRRICGLLTRNGDGQMEARFSAAIPILHWVPRKHGIAYDISVNNMMGVVNSRLISCYASIDRRVYLLGFAVKRWAQQRDINDRSRGTLSSFALLLMLISFLQNLAVPILPSLQDIAYARNYGAVYLKGVDCRYTNDADEIEEELKYLRGKGKANEDGVGKLLIQFFRYYGYEYKYGIIAIRNCKALEASVEPAAYYLHVDNPFEMGKDVANVTSSNYWLIRHEFSRAYNMLIDGYSFLNICEGNGKRR